jgi:hypothetical protein
MVSMQKHNAQLRSANMGRGCSVAVRSAMNFWNSFSGAHATDNDNPRFV